ncbi:MAG TPA: hypothetical protein VFY10_11645 [Dehalococcoidia bacterium]|nr:hypothetical protein [Dehalococcoidia bacterium]
MDITLIGTTAAKLMDGIDNRDGEVIAVALIALIAVIDEDEGESTYTRVEFSHERRFEQLGLLHAGLDVVTDGTAPEENED